MRFSLLSATLAVTFLAAAPLAAQQNSRDALRQYNQQTMPHEDRDWRKFADYDFDRLESGQSKYYANRYYRDYRYYEPRALGREDRVYRGGDSAYYCRRPDGTTGRIGGLAGKLPDNLLRRGGSDLLGVLADASGTAAIGQSVDSGKLICR
ncbi:glycine zipper 2TM domain-containing protein [Sphingopyxis sp.]|uniref:glycine zipper 2TM domain-containing protein n=1 Tax=Sphingopyxis sp. TaxID=1908224 RepID=UPI003D12C907